jgi:lactobin A/cerein 7B family class IIb bacteriocin
MVEYLEHNIMRELNVNEIKEVNGGYLKIIYRLAAAVLVGTGAIDAYNGFVDGYNEGYEERNQEIENGQG